MAAFVVVGSLSVPCPAQRQIVDPEFKVHVEKPAYRRDGPTVAIDEGHRNFHTKGTQYRPFADLLTSDGYKVVAFSRKFEKGSLVGIKVLVISNANAGVPKGVAFTEEECDVIEQWVRRGGSLLLIADHAPYGASAENLSKRFGVTMGKGWVYDKTANAISTQLDFSHTNGLLGDHSILRGRDQSEEVKAVRTFTGQSLGIPNRASVLLKLSPTAREAIDTDALNAAAAASRNPSTPDRPNEISGTNSVGGRAQGVALKMGKGRVVILGEAAMFSAQVVTLPVGDQERTFKAGMNVAGNDNRQFALNVLHWLSGLLK